MSSFYINFFKNKITNENGLKLKDILNYNDKELEDKHNFIQYIFPLKSLSKYNPNAPIIDDEFIKAAKSDKKIRENIVRVYKRMMSFYGFDLKTRPLRLVDRNEKKHWLKKNDHNYLRLSRIINFLFLVRMEILGYILFKELSKLRETGEIDDKTFKIWSSYFM
jgi:hypothetical protein